ncbi:MAG: hypothetical protein LV479_01615 [Methylacidiphilales bacterium]|nr:hypothetical protein [Candidatus Methylacidiphilales bacterium]
MLSLEKEHPAYAKSCRNLRMGRSAYSLIAEIPFDLHRYRDGWHVYWKNPPDGQIGRHLRTRIELNAFLTGNWRVGSILESPVTHIRFRRATPKKRS